MPVACVSRPIPIPIFTIWCNLIATLAYLLLMMPYGLSQHYDNQHNIEATPVLNLQEGALTTVLLVSNDAGDSYRRFHSLRPEVGLLTSTARTFIQNGVTTEYATQVVGTKLDNGRVYAQYLKKSSRVLYENDPFPTVVTSWVGDSTILPQSHNDLYNADRPDWQDQDDRLRKVFVGNTDFVGEVNENHIKSNPSVTDRLTLVNPLPSQFPSIKTVYEVNHASETEKLEDKLKKFAAQKVLPISDLPTYTVKNNFSPSGFSWVENAKENEGKNQNSSPINKNENVASDVRSPKQYYQQIMGGQGGESVRSHTTTSYATDLFQKRKLATTTYYGFADFTTIVGDSVIVFSPSSSSPQVHLGQVTSIKGEATLGQQSSQKVSYVPITVTEDLIVPTFSQNNQVFATQISTDTTVIESDTTSWQTVKDESTSSDVPDMNEIKTSESTTESAISIQSNPAIQISSSLSRPSDEEISAIFSMLQKNDKSSMPNSSSPKDIQTSEVVSVSEKETSTPLIEPSTVTAQGGATTIFFEEDPFANFVDPTSTSTENPLPADDKEETSKKPTETPDVVTVSNDILSPSIEESSILQSIYSVVSSTASIQVDTTASLNPTTLQSGIVIKELLDNESDLLDKCLRTSQVFLTQLPKVVTYFTTYFTEQVGHPEVKPSASTETNVVNTFEILETTKNYCIQSTTVAETLQTEKPFEDTPMSESTSRPADETKKENELMVQTQNPLEENEYETTTSLNSDIDFSSGDGSIDEEDDSSEELEVIFKTLYTTYTYLTTIFQESSSNVLSHTEVITNVITSTLGDIQPSSTESLQAEIMPSATQSSENKLTALNNLDSIIREEEESFEQSDNPNAQLEVTPTEHLEDFELNTFQTTYTYFTTIFADGETEILSRTEVLTNVITVTPSSTIASSINASPENNTSSVNLESEAVTENDIKASSIGPLNYSTMIRNSSVVAANPSPDFGNYSLITLVTDVRSSSSSGEGHVIKDISRPNNYSQQEQIIDDQISSESNTEEIIPSATLLLQTSFTTFTYYTTMYNNNDTNIISRLETVTNVVTETLSPSAKNSPLEEATLPVTYFTTFTYWTKLAKDGVISTLSREETISNVVTPTSNNIEPTRISSIETLVFNNPDTHALDSALDNDSSTSEAIVPEKTLVESVPEPTTYYTTYTYYTTSYESDSAITNSRFETITNVVTPTVSIVPDMSSKSPTDSTTNDQLENKLSTTEEFLLYDYKKIIDADGISTLFFETRVSPTRNEDGIPVEVTRSSSSLYIDELKKNEVSTISLSSTVNSEGSTVPIRQYKTGLVRLIEGTRIGNHTTTLYQSRVIGTLIENRYAQIIESTSSFLFEKVPSSYTEISPSKTENYMVEATQTNSLNPSAGVLESSTGDLTDADIDESTKPTVEDDEEDEQNNNARLPFQSKKRTFTPVIRPFASRNRPQFAPKKKSGIASSATIITRSDFTPTITVTPALKSTGRFSSSKRASDSSLNAFGLSSSRRFSRPGKSTLNANKVSSTGNAIPNSSSFAGGRNRFGVSSRGSAALGTSLRRLPNLSRSSLPGSAGFRPGFSSGYNSNARFRIKPTATLGFGLSASPTDSLTTPSPDNEEGDEENSTQDPTNDEDVETSTENARRNQNPLLRFRRPLTRPNEPAVQRGTGNSNNLVSVRRNPLTSRAKTSPSTTTTTSTTPKSRPRGFQRPTIAALPGRQRPQSNLFPPRGLFQAQKQDENSNKNAESEGSTTENSEGNDDDAEYDDDEGEDSDGENSERKRRSSSKAKNKIKSAIKIGKPQKRSKREADVSYPPRSNFRNRFRQPKTISSGPTSEERKVEEDTLENSTQQPAPRLGRINSRFGTKHRSLLSSTTAMTVSHRGIRPTRPSTARSQFTLREKDITTTTKAYQRHNAGSFKRPQTTTSARRASTSNSNNRRLKAYANNNIGTETSSRSGNIGSRMRPNTLNNGRSRPSPSRGRNRNEFNMDLVSKSFDGIITVTHVIPSEITIPVVNGQLTEYKNVITAKTSTEVVNPQQYSTFIGTNGQTTLALTREESMTNIAGATEVTQFILHESLTSTVTFTPTTIRGRKTSFSHIVPSTAYSVEKLVSTMQPQLSNAPLANILLSQLLLGNIGLPGQAPSNPLLGALSQPLLTTQTQLSPVTDYRTHTSTYVTTIFEGMSTILPVTFQGKKILTTVYDTTAQTITATEFITDTIVTTPTQQVNQPAQVNSLLLQQLLLQQQIQPQFTQDVQSQGLLKELLSPESNLQELNSNNLQDREEDIEIPTVEETQLMKSTTRKKSRKSGKSGHRRNKSQGTSSTVESSVITLYVSGRRPGEFSTILSTVQANGDSSLQKREVDINVEKTIAIGDENDFYAADGSDFVSEYSLPESFQGLKILTSSQQDNHLSLNILDTSENSGQTQTLESIVGDVSLWIAKSSTLPSRRSTKHAATKYKTNASVDFLE